MNHYIQIALIFWTLFLAGFAFFDCARLLSIKEEGAGMAGAVSFLSLITVLLAVGQYIH
jgi:hypothetical protein